MFTNIQEQEEFEYEFGRASDEQNAYDLAHMEWDRVWEWDKVKEALDKGKIVLVREWTSYCPFTDAILGGNMEFVRTYEPNEDLPVLECDEDIVLSYRYPYERKEEIPVLADEDIPF